MKPQDSGLPFDVAAYIERKFAPDDQEAARLLLISAVIEDGSMASPRLMRCAVVASAGSLDRLPAEAARLKIDWRDVVVAGEYEALDGTLERVRDLDDPIPSDA